ncbi:hypothetical protein L7F22_014109, partial [Adiantum nelumboides]|nr:hypothetical protein [Adiantum nelumboides]
MAHGGLVPLWLAAHGGLMPLWIVACGLQRMGTHALMGFGLWGAAHALHHGSPRGLLPAGLVVPLCPTATCKFCGVALSTLPI